VLLLALLLVSPVRGHSGPAGAAPAIATALARIDIVNFGRVNERYYRGGELDVDDYPNLVALGIRSLIDLRSDDADPNEKVMAEHAGIAYFQIPMTTRRAPTTANVAEFLKIVMEPLNQPVYVHCVGGRHRTGVMTAIYRMTQDGWTSDQAFKEMKKYNFGPDFLHPEFKAFVYAYRAISQPAP
jgi:protein tyrosine phosphatase (PTP) superfamily phosphohydrolase (DUF442 family)